MLAEFNTWRVAMSSTHGGPSRADLGASLEDLPTRQEIDTLKNLGVVLLVLGPVSLSSADPLLTLNIIAFLRDCRAARLNVAWELIHNDLPLHQILHLQAPSNAQEISPGWSSDLDEIATLHWRRGPGFAYVKRKAGADEGARYTIDEEPLLTLFQEMMQPVFVSDKVRNDIEPLLEERLALQVGEYALTLACRMRV